LTRHASGRDPAARVDVVLHHVEDHAAEAAILDHAGLRRAADDDLDILFLGVAEFPGGSLEELPRLARHHLHLLRPEAQGSAAAVHGGIAPADDQDLLADGLGMAEGYGLQPVE